MFRLPSVHHRGDVVPGVVIEGGGGGLDRATKDAHAELSALFHTEDPRVTIWGVGPPSDDGALLAGGGFDPRGAGAGGSARDPLVAGDLDVIIDAVK